MSNGNGTDVPNESNPISPYIRPGSAIAFGLVGLLLLVVISWFAIQAGMWYLAVALDGVCLIPTFWYFGIRGGDKAQTKMLDMFQTGISVASKINGTPPKVESGQVDLSKTILGDIARKLEDTVPAVDPWVLSGENKGTKEPLPVSTASLVKDRVEAAVAIAATDTGMWDVLFGAFNQRAHNAVVEMLRLNPNMGTLDAVQKVVDEYYALRLDAKQCGTIQSILGLPAAIFAIYDGDVLRSIKTSIERDPVALGYQREIWRKLAIAQARKQTIDEAASRVQNQNLSIRDRELALQEFGLSPEDAHKTQWAGGVAMVYYVIPGASHGSYVDFAGGYWLLGFTPSP